MSTAAAAAHWAFRFRRPRPSQCHHSGRSPPAPPHRALLSALLRSLARCTADVKGKKKIPSTTSLPSFALLASSLLLCRVTLCSGAPFGVDAPFLLFFDNVHMSAHLYANFNRAEQVPERSHSPFSSFKSPFIIFFYGLHLIARFIFSTFFLLSSLILIDIAFSVFIFICICIIICACQPTVSGSALTLFPLVPLEYTSRVVHPYRQCFSCPHCAVV